MHTYCMHTVCMHGTRKITLYAYRISSRIPKIPKIPKITPSHADLTNTIAAITLVFYVSANVGLDLPKIPQTVSKDLHTCSSTSGNSKKTV